MSARMKGRRRQVDDIVDRTRRWAEEREDLVAALVVGSHAHGRPRMASDVDIVLVVAERDQLLADPDFFRGISARGRVIRRRDWGPLHECRVRLPSGLQVEFGVTGPGWLEEPVDAGTARVLVDGCRIVHDRGPAAAVLTSLGLPVVPWRGVTP